MTLLVSSDKMSSKVDMSLEDIISKKKAINKGRGRGGFRNRGAGRGGNRGRGNSRGRGGGNFAGRGRGGISKGMTRGRGGFRGRGGMRGISRGTRVRTSN